MPVNLECKMHSRSALSGAGYSKATATSEYPIDQQPAEQTAIALIIALILLFASTLAFYHPPKSNDNAFQVVQRPRILNAKCIQDFFGTVN